MSTLARIGKFYRCMLCRHPIIVQSIQTGFLMASGDVLAQKLVENRCELDRLRTAQFFGLGTLLVGPAVSVWYKFLSKIVSGSGKSVAVKKMALDQLLFAPTFLVVFLVAVNTLQGKDFECIKKEFKHKYHDILISNYKLWPMAQLVNFFMVPLLFQVLFAQVVALAWNTYLSWKTQHKIKDVNEVIEED